MVHKGLHYSRNKHLGLLIKYYYSSGINQQTVFQIKEQSVMLENIYMKDHLHAVKMLAYSKNVNVDYTSATSKKTEKGNVLD